MCNWKWIFLAKWGAQWKRKNEWVQIKIITEINPFAMPVQVAKFPITSRMLTPKRI